MLSLHENWKSSLDFCSVLCTAITATGLSLFQWHARESEGGRKTERYRHLC